MDWRIGVHLGDVLVEGNDILARNSAAMIGPALTLPDKPSIAVLPFANMSGTSVP